MTTINEARQIVAALRGSEERTQLNAILDTVERGDINAIYHASVQAHNLMVAAVERDEYARLVSRGLPPERREEGLISAAQAVWSACDQAMPRKWPADVPTPW